MKHKKQKSRQAESESSNKKGLNKLQTEASTNQWKHKQTPETYHGETLEDDGGGKHRVEFQKKHGTNWQRHEGQKKTVSEIIHYSLNIALHMEYSVSSTFI